MTTARDSKTARGEEVKHCTDLTFDTGTVLGIVHKALFLKFAIDL